MLWRLSTKILKFLEKMWSTFSFCEENLFWEVSDLMENGTWTLESNSPGCNLGLSDFQFSQLQDEGWQEADIFMHIHTFLEKMVLSNSLTHRHPVKRTSYATLCFWVASRAAWSGLSWGRLVCLGLAPLNPGCLLSGLQYDCLLPALAGRDFSTPFPGSHPKLTPSGNDSWIDNLIDFFA